MGNMKNME